VSDSRRQRRRAVGTPAPAPHPQQPPPRKRKRVKSKALALERAERRDGILADKQSKANAPARRAIASPPLLPAPNGNESASR